MVLSHNGASASLRALRILTTFGSHPSQLSNNLFWPGQVANVVQNIVWAAPGRKLVQAQRKTLLPIAW